MIEDVLVGVVQGDVPVAHQHRVSRSVLWMPIDLDCVLPNDEIDFSSLNQCAVLERDVIAFEKFRKDAFGACGVFFKELCSHFL